MTRQEVFDVITSEAKWYSGKFSVQSASRIIRKHKEGKYNNYIWLFNKFGYSVNNQESWKKEN